MGWRDVSVAISDVVKVDWDATNNRWLVAALMPDFSTMSLPLRPTTVRLIKDLQDRSKARGDIL
jgi:hypothetical protein